MIYYMNKETVAFRILVGRTSTKSRTTALDFGKEDVKLFMDLLGRILCDMALERRGIQENENITPVFKKGKQEAPGSYRPVSVTSVPGEKTE